MIELTLGHSPDPDDAFMWWPIAPLPGSGLTPSIDTGGFRFTPLAMDISELNGRAAAQGDLDITAISMFALAQVADRYMLTHCGASMGMGYGPKLLARGAGSARRADLPQTGPLGIGWLRPGMKVAIPGERTTAYLVLRLMLGERSQGIEFVPMPFDRIIPALLRGDVDAGLVIHEAQVTYQDSGLELIADLGAWWTDTTRLPLPLGANAVRRDLDERFGKGTLTRLCGVLEASIRHALEHRERGLDYAMRFAGDTPRMLADRFISLYVNDLTLDMGVVGVSAVRELLGRATGAGLGSGGDAVDVVGPAGVLERRGACG